MSTNVPHIGFCAGNRNFIKTLKGRRKPADGSVQIFFRARAVPGRQWPCCDMAICAGQHEGAVIQDEQENSICR